MHFRAPVVASRLIVLFALLGAGDAFAARPVPPVPGKLGPAGPHEGMSTSRLQLFAPGTPGGAARAPVGSRLAMNVIAIRVAFSDTPLDSSTAYYDRLLLFLKQYWGAQTEGAVDLNPVLADSVFTLSRPMAYYGDDDHFQARLVELVRDVVQAADSTIDFSAYQSIVIFHAGQGQEADVLDNSRDQIWSAFVTPQDFETVMPDTTGAGKIGIRTNDQISPGNYFYVKEAVELPESESQDGYVFGMTGVTCHEFGHQLGLPDLYDTNGDVGGVTQGIGPWDIMANGVWNFNGFCPAGLCAWSRMFLGLLTPLRAITGGDSIPISMLERQVGADARAVQIPLTQTEYLLLENRKQDLNDDGKFDFDDQNGNGFFDFYTDTYAGAEWDYYLPGDGTGSGMLIYHVDESKILAGLQDNVVNSDAARKGVALLEADGIDDLDGPPTVESNGSPNDVFRGGYKDALTPTTTPSSAAYGNVRTGVSITSISAADSTMSFDLAFERSKPGWPKLLSGRVRSAASLLADVDGDGKPELLVPIQRLNNTSALYVFEADGTNFLGGGTTPVPFATTTSAIASSPCVGDIDGVPGNEIVFNTVNGSVYAFHANGTEVLDGDSNPSTLGVLVAAILSGDHAQPVLGELDGQPGLEIVVGAPANLFGASDLTAISLAGGTVHRYTIPLGGSSEAPPVIADLTGDGTNSVAASAVKTTSGDDVFPGLYFATWDMFTDSLLVRESGNAIDFAAVPQQTFSGPTAVDLAGDGSVAAVVADDQGEFHAFRFAVAPHDVGDNPRTYVTVTERTGWPAPFPGAARGRLGEISAADLERDGHPEILQTGDGARVAALHWSGATRSGYPLDPADPLAPADSAGRWGPLVADVDGDGIGDVIPVLPDGRRLAFRGDGHPIAGFGELGSTGVTAPPILGDFDGDGAAEWIETFDSGTQTQIDVKSPSLPIPASKVLWGQYRNAATRNAVVGPAPGPTSPGTRIVSEVYGYPNPSRSGRSQVHYRLGPDARRVSIRIYDASGAQVADLPIGPADLLGSSEHSVVWDHASVASGVYVCRVEVQSAGGSDVRFTTLAVVR
ncbi:MAG: M6 family metalloprotease domain-containing protein [Hyphomicrobiales bacterium]